MTTINQNNIFYHIYPFGACAAPHFNDFQSAPQPRLRQIFGWLDHIQSLGANALYLGPVFESGSTVTTLPIISTWTGALVPVPTWQIFPGSFTGVACASCSMVFSITLDAVSGRFATCKPTVKNPHTKTGFQTCASTKAHRLAILLATPPGTDTSIWLS